MGFPGGAMVKNPPANAGDVDLIPGSGRSPRVGNGSPLQCSCLKNSMKSSLEEYGPWDHKELDTIEHTRTRACTHTHTHTHTHRGYLSNTKTYRIVRFKCIL